MLYEEAGEHRLAPEMTALRGLREGHPELGAEELQPSGNAPERETEQDMETEGPGSLVTPNEDDLLTGAAAADVETGIASLHVDSPDRQGGNGDATT